MIHYNIETVMKEAEESWERHNIGKSPDTLGKVSFMLGWLKRSYSKMYEDIPPNKKPNLQNKYMQIWGESD